VRGRIERRRVRVYGIFALRATTDLGEAIASARGPPLAAHEERQFEDGEHKTRPIETVGGMDVYVVQSLHGGPSESANDKLCRLLFITGALKDAGAARVVPARIPAKHQLLLHLAGQAPCRDEAVLQTIRELVLPSAWRGKLARFVPVTPRTFALGERVSRCRMGRQLRHTRTLRLWICSVPRTSRERVKF